MGLRTISLIGLFLGMTNSAFAADPPALPKLPPGHRYEFKARVMSVNEMSPVDRLQGACDMAERLDDRLKSQKIGEDASLDLSTLHDLVCGSSYCKEDGSIQLLEKFLGDGELTGLRVVQRIRSKVKGHSGSSEAGEISRRALAAHESYAAHFESVCIQISQELEKIEALFKLAK